MIENFQNLAIVVHTNENWGFYRSLSHFSYPDLNRENPKKLKHLQFPACFNGLHNNFFFWFYIIYRICYTAEIFLRKLKIMYVKFVFSFAIILSKEFSLPWTVNWIGLRRSFIRYRGIKQWGSHFSTQCKLNGVCNWS